ncbi:MAG: class I SAM-dependent methyltransferase [Anderseniella sp.]
MSDREKYVTSNKEAWNEAAARHAAHNQARLREQFADGGYNHLSNDVIAMLERVGITGRSAVQIACNNGKDLLSLKNMGAARCLGIDQADAFVAQARELAEIAGHDGDVSFLTADVYALPANLNGRFDIAMTTVGVLGWMPDLDGFFQAVSDLMVAGGHWVMEEMHPVLMMYEPDDNGGPSGLVHSYFQTEPFVETTGLDYFGYEQYSSTPHYSFTHKMSDIVNAGIKVGLELQYMHEVGRNISNFCGDLEQVEARPPMGLYMLWRKK